MQEMGIDFRTLWDQLYTSLLLGKKRALWIERVFPWSREMQNLTDSKQTAKLQHNAAHIIKAWKGKTSVLKQ